MEGSKRNFDSYSYQKEFIEKLDSAVKLILNSTRGLSLDMPKLISHTYKSNKFIFAGR